MLDDEPDAHERESGAHAGCICWAAHGRGLPSHGHASPGRWPSRSSPSAWPPTRKRARFEAEARTLAALNHPHICTLHDVGSQDGIDFLVMEYLEGETLERGRRARCRSIRRCMRHSDRGCARPGHRAGIVHRDLKPGNIMLTSRAPSCSTSASRKPRRRGADRLSAVPTQDGPLTAPGTILGTIRYMAPEQLEGHEADGRTDIFAFGAVL